ncbi:MAG: tRNA lysidine(34) synthetase TilS [Bacteroidota bacterium]
MQNAFLSYIKKENLFTPSDKILLTVSGGIDSVVMCELFYKAKLNFAIAHCNFQLRGKESDGDELFVKQLASTYKVPFFYERFDTSTHADKYKISIQMAARDLRYGWFEEIRKKEKFQYLATAHHLNDSIETFFINLLRGTGIAGLHGILPKQGKIIRPLLFATKNEIEAFAKKNKLKHHEDSSNVSDKYVRNKLRHHVIPIFKELNPDLENGINETVQRLKNVELIYKNEIENKRATIVKEEKNSVTISIRQLKKLQPLSAYLYNFLKLYNFNASTVEAIIAALDGESGKQFFSDTHRLIKDRDLLIIESLKSKVQSLKFKVKTTQKELFFDGLKLKFKSLSKLSTSDFRLPTSATIDFHKLQFPLEIRKWEKGDVFYPLGMKGKKKLSDFFIDKKLSISQKENAWLLTSKGQIVWIIGLRIDDRFKITDKTDKIYLAELV